MSRLSSLAVVIVVVRRASLDRFHRVGRMALLARRDRAPAGRFVRARHVRRYGQLIETSRPRIIRSGPGRRRVTRDPEPWPGKCSTLMPLTTAAVELARELAPAVDVMLDNAWKIRALVAQLYQLTLQIVETGPPE
jgi:hypothetical protein